MLARAQIRQDGGSSNQNGGSSNQNGGSSNQNGCISYQDFSPENQPETSLPQCNSTTEDQVNKNIVKDEDNDILIMNYFEEDEEILDEPDICNVKEENMDIDNTCMSNSIIVKHEVKRDTQDCNSAESSQTEKEISSDSDDDRQVEVLSFEPTSITFPSPEKPYHNQIITQKEVKSNTAILKKALENQNDNVSTSTHLRKNNEVRNNINNTTDKKVEKDKVVTSKKQGSKVISNQAKKAGKDLALKYVVVMPKEIETNNKNIASPSTGNPLVLKKPETASNKSLADDSHNKRVEVNKNKTESLFLAADKKRQANIKRNSKIEKKTDYWQYLLESDLPNDDFLGFSKEELKICSNQMEGSMRNINRHMIPAICELNNGSLYKCVDCSYTTCFPSSQETKKHIRDHTTDDTLYKCHICDFKSFVGEVVAHCSVAHKTKVSIKDIYSYNSALNKKKPTKKASAKKAGESNRLYKCMRCDFESFADEVVIHCSTVHKDKQLKDDLSENIGKHKSDLGSTSNNDAKNRVSHSTSNKGKNKSDIRYTLNHDPKTRVSDGSNKPLGKEATLGKHILTQSPDKNNLYLRSDLGKDDMSQNNGKNKSDLGFTSNNDTKKEATLRKRSLIQSPDKTKLYLRSDLPENKSKNNSDLGSTSNNDSKNRISDGNNKSLGEETSLGKLKLHLQYDPNYLKIGPAILYTKFIICGKCNFVSTSDYQFIGHPCDDYSPVYEFDSPVIVTDYELLWHMRKTCCVCSRVQPTCSDLSNHYRDTHKKTNLNPHYKINRYLSQLRTCSICNFIGSNRMELSVHTIVLHMSQPTTMSTFYNKLGRISSDLKARTCNSCGLIAKSVGAREKHTFACNKQLLQLMLKFELSKNDNIIPEKSSLTVNLHTDTKRSLSLTESVNSHTETTPSQQMTTLKDSLSKVLLNTPNKNIQRITASDKSVLKVLGTFTIDQLNLVQSIDRSPTKESVVNKDNLQTSSAVENIDKPQCESEANGKKDNLAVGLLSRLNELAKSVSSAVDKKSPVDKIQTLEQSIEKFLDKPKGNDKIAETPNIQDISSSEKLKEISTTENKKCMASSSNTSPNFLPVLPQATLNLTMAKDNSNEENEIRSNVILPASVSPTATVTTDKGPVNSGCKSINFEEKENTKEHQQLFYQNVNQNVPINKKGVNQASCSTATPKSIEIDTVPEEPIDVKRIWDELDNYDKLDLETNPETYQPREAMDIFEIENSNCSPGNSEKSYSCYRCNLHFKANDYDQTTNAHDSFIEHIKNCRKKPYKCHVCGFQDLHLTNYLQHKKNCYESNKFWSFNPVDKSYLCEICKKCKSKNFQAIKIHVNRIHDPTLQHDKNVEESNKSISEDIKNSTEHRDNINSTSESENISEKKNKTAKNLSITVEENDTTFIKREMSPVEENDGDEKLELTKTIKTENFSSPSDSNEGPQQTKTSEPVKLKRFNSYRANDEEKLSHKVRLRRSKSFEFDMNKGDVDPLQAKFTTVTIDNFHPNSDFEMDDSNDPLSVDSDIDIETIEDILGVQTLACTKCDFVAKTKTELKDHDLTHSRKSLEKRQELSLDEDDGSNKDVIYTTNSELVCDICGYNATTWNSLKMHIADAHINTISENVEEEISAKSDLKPDNKKNQGLKKSLRKRQTRSKSMYSEDEITKSSVELVCDICGYNATTKKSLKIHISDTHINKTPDIAKRSYPKLKEIKEYDPTCNMYSAKFRTCEFCGYVSSNKGGLSNHLVKSPCKIKYLEKLSQTGEIQAQESNKNCETIQELTIPIIPLEKIVWLHLTSSTKKSGEPYFDSLFEKLQKRICNLCGWISKNKGGLSYHIGRIHSGQYNSLNDQGVSKVPCKYCTFRALNQNWMYSHQKMVHMITYSCEKCSFTTDNKNLIFIHEEAIHENEIKSIKQKVLDPDKPEKPTDVHININQLKVYQNTNYGVQIKNSNVKDVNLKGPVSNVPRSSLKCQICGFRALDKVTLEDHLFGHENGLHPCNICSFMTREAWNLERHKTQMHSTVAEDIRVSNLKKRRRSTSRDSSESKRRTRSNSNRKKDESSEKNKKQTGGSDLDELLKDLSDEEIQSKNKETVSIKKEPEDYVEVPIKKEFDLDDLEQEIQIKQELNLDLEGLLGHVELEKSTTEDKDKGDFSNKKSMNEESTGKDQDKGNVSNKKSNKRVRDDSGGSGRQNKKKKKTTKPEQSKVLLKCPDCAYKTQFMYALENHFDTCHT